MIPYLIIMFYLLLICYNDFFLKSNSSFINKIFNYKTGFIVLFLFAALRGNGNGDYETYIYGIKKIQGFQYLLPTGEVHFEFGFRFLAIITNQLNLHPQFVLITMNAISFGATYYFCNKYSKKPSLSLLLFYSFVLLFDMHHSRSAVAIGMGLMMFDSILEKKYFRMVFYFIVGFLFHKTTVILVLLPIVLNLNSIKKIQQKYKHSIWIKLGCIMFLMIIFYLLNPIRLVVNLLDNSLTAPFYVKLNAYLANPQWTYPFKFYDPRLLLLIGVYLTYSLTNNYKNKVNNKLAIMQALSIITVIVFSISTILVTRSYSFFSIFYIVFIPNMIMDMRQNVTKDVLRAMKPQWIKSLARYSQRINTLLAGFIVFSYICFTFYLIYYQFEYFTVFGRFF